MVDPAAIEGWTLGEALYMTVITITTEAGDIVCTNRHSSSRS